MLEKRTWTVNEWTIWCTLNILDFSYTDAQAVTSLTSNLAPLCSNVAHAAATKPI